MAVPIVTAAKILFHMAGLLTEQRMRSAHIAAVRAGLLYPSGGLKRPGKTWLRANVRDATFRR